MRVVARAADQAGLATLSGVVVGIVVGLLSRLVMRVSGFMAGPAQAGVHTSNGNRVGDITLEGTAAIIVFVGVASGIAGGLMYAAVEPWVRRLRPWHGVAYGAALLATFGFTVLDPTNFDFARFGSLPLNLAMFAALFLLFGAGVAWLFVRLRALRSRTDAAGTLIAILAWLALVPAVALMAIVLFTGTVLESPLLILFLAGPAIAGLAAWRNLPSPIAYAALGATLLIGAFRTVGGVVEMLTAM